MLNKKFPHFQTFGLEVFIFTADAAKTKKLGERNRSLSVVGMGRGKEKIAMRVCGLVEHRSGEPILPFIDMSTSKNDTLVSLISHVNLRAGWKLLTK